jgi:rhodanese-related sulfurtransferase
MSDEMKRIGLEACVLIALGALCGLTLNHQLVLDAFSGRLAAQQQPLQVSAPAAMPVPVLLDEVRRLKASGALLVDARNPELYAMGHIEGAVSLPIVAIDDALPAFLDRVTRGRTLITYCSGFGCPDSFDLGVRLIAAGYREVRVYEGGFPEWRDAGLPIAGEG